MALKFENLGTNAYADGSQFHQLHKKAACKMLVKLTPGQIKFKVQLN